MKADIRSSQGKIHAEIARKVGVPKHIVSAICNAFISLIKKEVVEYKSVNIMFFGIFTRKKSRRMKSNLTGEFVDTVQRPIFNPSVAFQKECYDNEFEPEFDPVNVRWGREAVVLHDAGDEDLKMEIKKLKRTIQGVRKTNLSLKSKLAKITQVHKNSKRGYSYQFYRKKIELWGKSQKSVNDRAKEIVYDLMKVEMVTKSSYMNAISYYPILAEFQKSENMTLKNLHLFIAIAHFKGFKVANGVAFGYDTNSTSRILSKLVSMGLVEKFGDYRATYSLSLKGRKKFTELNNKCNGFIKELFRGYDKNMGKRNGGSPVRYRRKFLSDIDILGDNGTRQEKRL